ncbi:MAG: response regulator transcription factor [Prolixibacteraceae bacterium]|jgi:DNA-binding response OmpR family regulator|nr:response regulator transcription factor [Prolixibacteraceae bacterium]MBT6767067.1 response regulator transcription factor [Prolixibacteraceae bacterium]MBT6997426.1 response regulator transcription factor [Prolixibacteraceae bacterium]MBT7396637.1 response regulator transcription factor [Prolixibacteraceae bacterium]
MKKKVILVIEDDLNILLGLEENLILEEYSIITATNGIEGLKTALKNEIDLVLLDIMLPGINGYEICRKIKKDKPDLPVIMLTARGSEMDKVAGLDIGADDYITKPFSLPELLARIRAAFRRINKEPGPLTSFSYGKVKLDFKNLQAFYQNREVKLSNKEFDIMEYLILHDGKAVHRHDLLNEVWGFEAMPTTRTVDNFILDLRKKLEENPSDPKYIISVRGVGYKFNSLN